MQEQEQQGVLLLTAPALEIRTSLACHSYANLSPIFP
jgi:hypothetical protein